MRVYLATDAGGETFKDIGALKGSKGTQQYAIAAGIDLARYDTVVFWCVPFSQSLASARAEARLTAARGEPASGVPRRSPRAGATPRRGR